MAGRSRESASTSSSTWPAAVRALERDLEQVSLKLVAVDANGDGVEAEKALIEDIEIQVE